MTFDIEFTDEDRMELADKFEYPIYSDEEWDSICQQAADDTDFHLEDEKLRRVNISDDIYLQLHKMTRGNTVTVEELVENTLRNFIDVTKNWSHDTHESFMKREWGWELQ